MAEEPGPDSPDQRPGLTQAGELLQRKTKGKKLPLYLRTPAERYGYLSLRLSPRAHLFFSSVVLAGAAGWALVIFFFLDKPCPLLGRVDLAGAAILAIAGVAAQYRLVLNRRVMEAPEEFPDRRPGAGGSHRVIAASAHRPPHPMRDPLAVLRRAMSGRLRALHGRAVDDLRRRPSGDALAPAEILACLVFALTGIWGAFHIVDFCRQPPEVIDMRNLAGSCIAVVVGAFMGLRLFFFALISRRAAAPGPGGGTAPARLDESQAADRNATPAPVSQEGPNLGSEGSGNSRRD